MNNKIFTGVIIVIIWLALILPGCNKDNPASQKVTQSEQVSVLKKAGGATQISGVGFFDATDECNSAGQGVPASVFQSEYF
jgi:hypothetical protein